MQNNVISQVIFKPFSNSDAMFAVSINARSSSVKVLKTLTELRKSS